ncbi:MAG TPA: Uma2 family endonuclease [Vicinamibacteria bacterium]|nr:Uma2 family endonuclease [Vicinamibacteria bacterium]
MVKASLYARFGIPEYWIVDVGRERVEVYRDPDAAAGRYARQETVQGDDRLVPSLLPQIDIRVADIFA